MRLDMTGRPPSETAKHADRQEGRPGAHEHDVARAQAPEFDGLVSGRQPTDQEGREDSPGKVGCAAIGCHGEDGDQGDGVRQCEYGALDGHAKGYGNRGLVMGLVTYLVDCAQCVGLRAGDQCQAGRRASVPL